MSRKFELISLIFGDLGILSAIFFISWKASAINFSAVSWHAIFANVALAGYWFFIFQTLNYTNPAPISS